MLHEFYIKRQVEKETVHDADLGLYSSEISCKQDLGQDTRYRNVSRS